jgi:hypothetical protein
MHIAPFRASTLQCHRRSCTSPCHCQSIPLIVFSHQNNGNTKADDAFLPTLNPQYSRVHQIHYAINTIQAAEIKGIISRCRGARLFFILAIKHDHVHRAQFSLPFLPFFLPADCRFLGIFFARAVVKKFRSACQTNACARFTIESAPERKTVMSTFLQFLPLSRPLFRASMHSVHLVPRSFAELIVFSQLCSAVSTRFV